MPDCKADNGGCEHSCDMADQHEAYCYCEEGFKLEAGENDSADFPTRCVRDCEQDNAGCQHICNTDSGEASCFCEAGYKLVKGEYDSEDFWTQCESELSCEDKKVTLEFPNIHNHTPDRTFSETVDGIEGWFRIWKL